MSTYSRVCKYATRILTRRLIFLLGVFIGLLIQTPYVCWLERTPKIVAEPVSNDIYLPLELKVFIINKVPSWGIGRPKKPLIIHVGPANLVNREGHQRRLVSDPNTELLGFYDPLYHEIWCVNSVDVLIHELRHVFEGAYHR